jgi:hypothetical protein
MLEFLIASLRIQCSNQYMEFMNHSTPTQCCPFSVPLPDSLGKHNFFCFPDDNLWKSTKACISLYTKNSSTLGLAVPEIGHKLGRPRQMKNFFSLIFLFTLSSKGIILAGLREGLLLLARLWEVQRKEITSSRPNS